MHSLPPFWQSVQIFLVICSAANAAGAVVAWMKKLPLDDCR